MAQSDRLRDLVRGCLIGSAVGDALGAPYENLDALQIAYGVNDPDGVTGFIKDDRGCDKIIKQRLYERPAGLTTDDTQLTDATASSLIKSDGYNRTDQVQTLVEQFRRNYDGWDGWGGTILIAAAELEVWQYWGQSPDRCGRDPLSNAPLLPSPGQSCGNGVAMRVAPLALYHALIFPNESELFFDHLRNFGLMTHGDPRAWIATVGIALTISEAILNGPLAPLPENENLRSPDGHGVYQETASFGLSDLAQNIVCNTMHLEDQYTQDVSDEDSLTIRLATAFETSQNAEALRKSVGTSGYALESVPFSIATFFRHPTDFRTAVLEAVNAGGDTDTNAAMVGAMVGANVGESGIPESWIRDVPACIRMRQLADDLFNNFYLRSRN